MPSYWILLSRNGMALDSKNNWLRIGEHVKIIYDVFPEALYKNLPSGNNPTLKYFKLDDRPLITSYFCSPPSDIFCSTNPKWREESQDFWLTKRKGDLMKMYETLRGKILKITYIDVFGYVYCYYNGENYKFIKHTIQKVATTL
jgi:hypothetical protein